MTVAGGVTWWCTLEKNVDPVSMLSAQMGGVS